MQRHSWIYDCFPQEIPAAFVYCLLSLTLYIFLSPSRSATVKDIVYYPVLQCRPIHLLETFLTPEGLSLNRAWAIFTDNHTLADLSLYPDLANIQPTFHYDHSPFPAEMELTYESRKVRFRLKEKHGSGTSFECGCSSGTYDTEDIKASQWLTSIFHIDLHIAKVAFPCDSLEAKSVRVVSTTGYQDFLSQVPASYYSEFPLAKLRANILIDTKEDSPEKQWIAFNLGEVGFQQHFHMCPEFYPVGNIGDSCWALRSDVLGVFSVVLKAGLLKVGDQVTVLKTTEEMY